MSAENRLSPDQIAALNPGDQVTIESGTEFNRRRYAAAIVTQVAAHHVYVSCDGPKGVKYVERYRIRDGVREGGGRAELVRADDGAQAPDARRQTQHIDALYRVWHRRPSDLEALRELRDAITEQLDEALVR